MGKVKIELVKRASRELINRYPTRFTANFEENKQFLKEIKFTSSKRIRNRLAGYITRIMKSKAAQISESTEVETESQENSETNSEN